MTLDGPWMFTYDEGGPSMIRTYDTSSAEVKVTSAAAWTSVIANYHVRILLGNGNGNDTSRARAGTPDLRQKVPMGLSAF